MGIDRRKFVTTTGTFLGGLSLSGIRSLEQRGSIRFGIVTDLHYADRAPDISLNRFYNESIIKMSECIDLMNDQNVDFLIELGDFKDQGNPPEESETLAFLSKIESEYSRFKGPRYHVLGNHDHDSISKQQFLDRISNEGFAKASGYYSFDRNSFHFVVLDANYTLQGIEYDNGNFDWRECCVPDNQLKWLRNDLKRHKNPAVVFIHQRLDTPPSDRVYCPCNAEAVRKILEDYGNVKAVFQGHYHEGDLNRINNIYYYTLKSVIEGSGPENNNFAIVEIGDDMNIRVKGFRKSISTDLK